MSDPEKQYKNLSMLTANNLKTVAMSMPALELSRLTLPEVEAVVDQVARMVPAGNVPGMILSGLNRLSGSGRKLSQETVRRDINLLFKGVEKTLDTTLYGTFFAGPAAVIWGYQNLLKLSGKNPDDAFPEGPWQFYVDYSMREDTARHANETHGFDSFLRGHNIRLSTVDRITAWAMAAIHCLHQYPALLANEWRERVFTSRLSLVTANEPDVATYAQLYRQWATQIPYGRGPDAASGETYPAYRQRKFDKFLAPSLQRLSEALRSEWAKQIQQAEAQDLPAYQKQMSILAYLDPGPYGETRTPFNINVAQIGLVYQGGYYLLPACEADTDQPAGVERVRAAVSAMVGRAQNSGDTLLALAKIKRTTWPDLRKGISSPLLAALDRLRQAPILINCDTQSRHLPLAQLRQAERGIGDQPLTIFDTGETIVLDQSHIFFDGAWGAALAEIMTGEALAWANYLHRLSDATLVGQEVPERLELTFQEADRPLFYKAPTVTPEVNAETSAVNIGAILALRRLFKQRSDLLQLTVNDLLILYRAIHAATYQPAQELITELTTLSAAKSSQAAASAALKAIDTMQQLNPAIVMPVDGSRPDPRERLYPITFEVPLADLDLLNLHGRVMETLDAYQRASENRAAAFAAFDQSQRHYLRTLAGFGELLSKAKEIAMAGESASVSALKLLAHMPAPLQRLLDGIPGRIDLLNDLIKGREVFSNVGAVAPNSTLTRFISAKDDNEKKTLVWGVITDAKGIMRITLRDFRPHVGLLVACGQQALATQLTRHYLDTYAADLNGFISDLHRITRSSRETQLWKPERNHG